MSTDSELAGGVRTCPVCGTVSPPGAHFCSHCGAPLSPPENSPAAERRTVTVLFGDLSEFTAWSEDLDPERVGVVTDRLLAALAAAVNEVGGHVDKLTGDGIMAVFGAPTAHEDDPQRAVVAAARMQEALRHLVVAETGGGRRLGLRVGLNTGEVLAGVRASLSYTVVGDTVNTASRLSDAAGVGEVVAGRDTALATMDVAAWRALTPLRLKGKRDPVPAYELVGLRPEGSGRVGIGDQAPFLGRDAEFGLLVGRLLEVIDSGVPSSVVVLGEAGVGKTRLVSELARFTAEIPGSRVLWGRCRPFGDRQDLAPVQDLVRTALGLDGLGGQVPAAGDTDFLDTVQRARRTVERLLERGPLAGRSGTVSGVHGVADRLLALIGAAEDTTTGVLRVTAPGTVLPSDPALEAVLALFNALAADGPLVLVVDDVQWASRTLRDLFIATSGRLDGPVLVIGIARPELLEKRPDRWQGLPQAELLPLGPLEPGAVERLLRAHLGGHLDVAVRTALLERAQGNPFFLAELLHLLVDRGLLVRDDAGAWTAAGELPPEILPAGVSAVLTARMDSLDPVAKGVLRDAAVVGSLFEPAALTALGHGTPDEVARGLATLVQRQFLRPEEDPNSEGGRAYSFAHTLARDVAYGSIPKAERAHRHAAVAAWAHGAGSVVTDLGSADDLTAWQAERAVSLATEMDLPDDDAAWAARDLAVAALVRLGTAELGRDNAAAAASLLGRGLRLATGDSHGTAWSAASLRGARVARGRALAVLHRLDEAEAELAAALGPLVPAESVGGPVLDEVALQGLLGLAEVRRRQGREDESVLLLDRLLEASVHDDRLQGEALRSSGMVDYFSGRMLAAEERFRRAHDLAVRTGDARGAGWALQQLAWSSTTRGDYAAAESAVAGAQEVFATLEDTGGLSWSAGTDALVQLLQGRYSEARELALGLLPLGEAMGDVWGIAACRIVQGWTSVELGDVTGGLEASRLAEEAFVELGDEWGRAFALIGQASAHRATGHHEEALALLAKARDASARARTALGGLLAETVGGYCLLELGRPGEAEAAGKAALELLDGVDLEPHAAVGPTVLVAQARRAVGDLDGALALLRRATETVEQATLLFPRRQALAHLAGTLLEAGRAPEALAAAREAEDTPAQDVRSQVLSVRALAAALAACGQHEEARAAAEEAVRRASATEQQAELAASRALRDRLGG